MRKGCGQVGGYAAGVAQQDGSAVDDRGRDKGGSGGDQRTAAVTGEHVSLPDQTSDDTDRGWGERASDNDERLLADRPPHWG